MKTDIIAAAPVRAHLLLAIGVMVATGLATSCKNDEPEYAEQPVVTATVPPPATATAPPPPAPQVGCDAVNMAAFTGIFGSRAAIEAPRMQPEGSVVCGNVAEGGTVAGTPFIIDTGKCYTVVANGLPNVTEIDVQLVIDATAAGLPANIAAMAATPIATDSETGAMGTIGPKQNCFKWTMLIPVPVKVVVKARNGSGPIGAQLYSRKI